MGRFGLLPDEVVDFVKRLIELPGIRLEGLYTQFAVADEADKTYTYKQWDVYKKVLKDLEETGIHIPIRHVCNSAATLNFPEMHLEMVRCGTAIYGHYPVAGDQPFRPLALGHDAEESGGADTHPAARLEHQLWAHLYHHPTDHRSSGAH